MPMARELPPVSRKRLRVFGRQVKMLLEKPFEYVHEFPRSC
jgi:hypothetical protein